MTDPFDDVVGDALTTVHLVPKWKLTKPAWEGVSDSLRQLADAIATGNPKLVRMASEHLDSLYPPTRLSAIPHGHAVDTRREAPPPGVMELVNTLVHPSGGWSADAGSTDRGSSL